MKILLACPMQDQQSGLYIRDSLIKLGNKVAYFDWRAIAESTGVYGMNQKLVDVVNQLNPDLVLIIKGLGIRAETIKIIKQQQQQPTIKIVGWIFDVTLGGTLVSQNIQYISMIKELDKFYTIDNSAVTELTELGVKADWLPEAAYLPCHQEVMFNTAQAKQYGSEIVFIGSVGGIHPNRTKILKLIYDEGLPLKIYGEVLFEKNKEPDWVKDCHTGFAVINDMHSLVCGSAKIVLGIDGWPTRDKAYSARLYRVLCANAFYLTTHTKNIEQIFKPGKHMDTYKTDDELITKLIHYLNHPEQRQQIAESGKTEVLANHLFEHRMVKLLNNIL